MRYIRVADSVRRKAVESVTGQLFFKVPEQKLTESPDQKSRSKVNETFEIPSNLLINMVGMTRFELATPSPPD